MHLCFCPSLLRIDPKGESNEVEREKKASDFLIVNLMLVRKKLQEDLGFRSMIREGPRYYKHHFLTRDPIIKKWRRKDKQNLRFLEGKMA